MPRSEARAELMKLPGVGPYTALDGELVSDATPSEVR
jgi:adenine-specific DNA glycosylase